MKDLLIAKLFSDSCSQEEVDLLLMLINEDPRQPSEALMRKLYHESSKCTPPPEDVKQRIHNQIKDRIEFEEKSSTSKPRSIIVYSIAASIAVLLGIVFWYSTDPDERIVKTDFGQQHAVELSDGSKVQLNANSQLVYDVTWSTGEDREVWLEGEAFFEIKKKPVINQKFQVITKDLVVEVLGTSFNVNSHGDKTSVYLEEGSIRLYLNYLDTALVMKAGDLIIYSEKNHQIERRNDVLAEYHTSWRDRVLTFQNASLKQVLDKIEETFGVEFKVVDTALYEREINYSLPTDELGTALSILKKTVEGLEIRQTETIIYLE